MQRVAEKVGQGRRSLAFPWAALALLLVSLLAGLRAEGQENGSSGKMPGSLAGTLLVATEELRDPRFVKSVIYMVRHDRQGAMGIMINRLIGEGPLAELLKGLGLETAGVSGDIRIHYGGPVEPRRGFVLHTGDLRVEGTYPVNDRYALTINPDLLRQIGLGHGPRRSVVTFGYSGWGAGQLEGEIARGSWISVPAEEELVFDRDLVTKWQRATSRRLYRM
jgi:putative transcriptional regulator